MASTTRLRILQLNIRGIKNKLLDLKTIIQEQNPDIISLNETLLSGKNTISIQGYTTILLNRPSQGGGIALLLKNNIKHDEVIKIFIDKHEIIQCKILLENNQHVYITSLYIPPHAKLNVELLTLLNKDNTILVGDLNCKHMKWGCNTTNKNGKTLKENLYDSGLENINLPLNYLHIKKNTTKYDRIQQVLTSIARTFQIENVKPGENLGSDHLPIYFDVTFKLKTLDNTRKLYHKINYNNVKEILSKIYVTKCSTVKQIEQKTRKLQECLD